MKRVATIFFLFTLVIGFGLWQVSKARKFQFFGEIVSEVESANPVAALTFDDGPTARYTDEVLSILRERQVKATFFVTGKETEANIDEARRIVADGHELGNHSYSHSTLVLKSLGEIREEIEHTDRAIRSAGYEGEIFFRPPFGKKLFLLPWYLARTQRATVMWDLEPESYSGVAKESNRIVKHVADRVKPGSIILMHVMYESRTESRKALPLIINSLRNRGYKFATVSELFRKDGA